MQITQILSVTAFLVPSVLALPSSLESRDSCVDTCGSTCYWASDISAAQDKGYQLYQSGQTLGDDKYPHQYNDYEGFSFPVDGPYYEFPILSSYEVYSGGSPGADRVVFNGNNQLAGLITHTGASGDDFVQCTSD
ncbi:hypothetical protein Plec18170_002258 [Paecilomyces lecythidis]